MLKKEFLERIRTMKLNREPPVKPYKPLMLVAVVVLIHKGRIHSSAILLDGALRSMFFQLFDALYPMWPKKTRPKPYDPFRALQSEGFWQLVPKPESLDRLRGELAAGVWHVLQHVKCARLDEEVFDALASEPAFREEVVTTLAARFLPRGAARKIRQLIGDDVPWARRGENEAVSEQVIEEALETHWTKSNLAREAGIRLADPEVDHTQCRQVAIPQGCVDLLGFQDWDRCWWVFELKYHDASHHAVGQTLGYVRAIREKQGAPATTGLEVKGAILTDDTRPRLLAAAQEGHLHVFTYVPEDVISGRPNFARVA